MKIQSIFNHLYIYVIIILSGVMSSVLLYKYINISSIESEGIKYNKKLFLEKVVIKNKVSEKKNVNKKSIKNVDILKKYKLLGITISDNISIAIIDNIGNKSNMILTIGDYINRKYKITKINPTNIILEYNKKEYKLELPSTINMVNIESKNINKKQNLLKSNLIEQKGFTREELKEAINDFSNIYKYFKFKIVTYKGNRFPKVTYIKSGSIIEKIGIEVGDIVTYINGVNIMDSVKIMKLFSSASDMRTFKVEIIREGVKGELNYEIY